MNKKRMVAMNVVHVVKPFTVSNHVPCANCLGYADEVGTSPFARRVLHVSCAFSYLDIHRDKCPYEGKEAASGHFCYGDGTK